MHLNDFYDPAESTQAAATNPCGTSFELHKPLNAIKALEGRKIKIFAIE